MYIGPCIELCPSNATNAQPISTLPGSICVGPLFAPPSTSARVQSRFEFVKLGGDMCSNYQGEVHAGTGITGWYQLVPRTIYVRVYVECRGTRFTCSIGINICMRTDTLWRTYGVPGSIYYPFCRCHCPPSLFLFRSFRPFVLSFAFVSCIACFPFFSLPCFPWWRILLFCYFVSALHPPRLASVKYACSPCVQSLCVFDVDFFFFFFSSVPFPISIWTSCVSSCLFLVGTMLSPRFRYLLRLVWHMICILIRRYADLTFLFFVLWYTICFS